ncbi:MAG: hypothetical protein WC052_03150 [Patescibacteria group bacterium]|jgi:hypothetical protein
MFLAVFAVALSVSSALAQQSCVEPTDCRLEQPSAVMAQIGVVTQSNAADLAKEKAMEKVDRRLDRKIAKQQAMQRLVAAPEQTTPQPISGSTQYCTTAYSTTDEQYCDEATGSYVHRSSWVSALSCCRYSFDAYGEYSACTAGLSVWQSDGNGGSGGGEGLRGRFTESPDGSIVVQRRNGEKLFFDVVTNPCAPATFYGSGGKTDYRQWSYESTDRRATTNFDHSPVGGQPWTGISHTVSTETVWEGFEVCERDVGE